MAQFNENLELLNASGITIQLTNEQAAIVAGGNGTAGSVRFYTNSGDNTNAAQASVNIDGSQASIAAGGQSLNGQVTILAQNGDNRIRLDGSQAHVAVGGNNSSGDVYLFNNGGDNETVNTATIHLNGQNGNVLLGGNGTAGDVLIRNNANENRIRLDGAGGNLWLGGHGADGDLVVFRSNGDNTTLAQATAHINGQSGDLSLGGNGVNGDIILKSTDSKNRVRLLGDANLWLGGNGADGDIVLFRSNGDNNTLGEASIHMDGQSADLFMGGNGVQGDIILRHGRHQDRARLLGDGNLWLGGNGVDGDIVMFRTTGDNKSVEKASIHLDGQSADLFMGGQGVNGDIVLKSTNNTNRIRLEGGGGNMWLGGNGADGDIVIFKANGDNTTLDDASIHMNGESGNIRCNDVIIPGADFAEDFDIEEEIADTLEPGTVMVLGRDGKLHESKNAFDKKVAGVVSGAGAYRAGITLDKQPNSVHRMPIALSGKVMCKIDASYGSIEVGDLITTSPRKGYAMKASDPYQSFGAVIGKALADFPGGDGLLPILVALQ